MFRIFDLLKRPKRTVRQPKILFIKSSGGLATKDGLYLNTINLESVNMTANKKPIYYYYDYKIETIAAPIQETQLFGPVKFKDKRGCKVKIEKVYQKSVQVTFYDSNNVKLDTKYYQKSELEKVISQLKKI